MDEYERGIREKVHAAGILTQGEWVYLVGTFQAASEIDEAFNIGIETACRRIEDCNDETPLICKIFSARALKK